MLAAGRVCQPSDTGASSGLTWTPSVSGGVRRHRRKLREHQRRRNRTGRLCRALVVRLIHVRTRMIQVGRTRRAQASQGRLLPTCATQLVKCEREMCR